MFITFYKDTQPQGYLLVLCILSDRPFGWLALQCIALCNKSAYWVLFAKLPLCLFVLFCHDFKPAKSAPSLFPAHTLKKRLNLEFCHLAAGECVDLTTLVICLRIYGTATYLHESLWTIDLSINKKVGHILQSKCKAFHIHAMLNTFIPLLFRYMPLN